MPMRELKVEDALLYLDQVKVEFGDQPHIYNEFLEIMKTFKTQEIDTPGVIARVSNLFRGNRRLVLGFNTFLPEGYKIELPEGDGPAVAVYRAPGSTVAHVLPSAEYPPPPDNYGEPAYRGGDGRPPSMQPQPPMHVRQPPPHLPPPGPHRGPYGGPPMPRAQPPPQRDGPPKPLSDQGPRGPMGQPPPSAAAAHRPPPNKGPLRQAPLQDEPKAPPAAAAPGAEPPQVMEFDHAINYVTTIKKRFSHEPYTYKKFLEILHTYQKEQRGIKEVLDEVSTLFADHPDLLKEFTYFLPDAVQAQAKAQLDQVAKEAEDRKRKQAMMNQAQGMKGQVASSRAMAAPRIADYDRANVPVPLGTSHARKPEHENDIIKSAHHGVVSFAPVRPPKKTELPPAQAATKYGRPTAIPPLPMAPNTAEATFFERAKEHLERKELAADKPFAATVKRHTPWTEFLKCLHLFGAGILNKDELLMMLKGLFMHGHAPKTGANAGGGSYSPSIAQHASELLRDFEDLLVGRGPFAQQEASFKDKSHYGGLRTREFDLEASEVPTPSYRTLPTDYPQSLFVANPGQSEMEAVVLNDELVCVGAEPTAKRKLSLEDYDGVHVRRNVYEEALTRIEDERYEVDMAIERNAQAMAQIEPFAEEAKKLREQEEKDGQPIGRLQYQLNRYAMNTIHINAIGRLYGDKGDEVLQHLVQNPLIVLPIVYERLKQKDSEWRKAKKRLSEQWKAAWAANYEGARDVKCYFKRRALEQRFSKSRLLADCKRARTFCIFPERIQHSDVIDPFLPEYAMTCSDPSAVLFQPYASTKCTVNSAHKDAFQLIVDRVKASGVSPFDRERAGRIWAEFVVPWFGYPAHWVMDEVRASFRGKLNPGVVKYASGQRVVTIFGEGSIMSFSSDESGKNPKYRVKLAFGVAYLSPSALLYSVPSKESPFVRRDGAMVRDDSLGENGDAAVKLGDKYKMLFGTESVYLFLRLYLVLCALLTDIHEHCATFDPPEDPTLKYCHLTKEGDNGEAKTPSPPTAQRLDYSGLLSALKQVLAGKMEAKEYESLGRKISLDKVHQMAALHVLVERCADLLVATAKEDSLLHLYDLCQHQHRVNPLAVRAHCFSVAPEAVYRIQYDPSSESLLFNYLPKGSDLLTAPPAENGKTDGDGAMDVSMEDEDDPIEDSDDDLPPTKRTKI